MLSKDGCKVEGWNEKEVFEQNISPYFIQVTFASCDFSD
jgi:hypothetical protein